MNPGKINILHNNKIITYETGVNCVLVLYRQAGKNIYDIEIYGKNHNGIIICIAKFIGVWAIIKESEAVA